MSIYKLVFSPTGGTSRVAQIITREWMMNRAEERDNQNVGDDHVYEIDLTLPEARAEAVYKEIPTITDQDLCIVAVPSYKGRVPQIALQRLSTWQAHGAATIEIVVYGNREFEDTLIELQDCLQQNGYRPVAAVCAIAEHSILRSVAAGRPDAQDRLQLQEFVKKIREKSCLSESISIPGNRPYKMMPEEPCAICVEDTCTQCGICSAACPVEAISVDEPRVTGENCIGCMRCVKVCPVGARHLTQRKEQFIQELLGKFAFERKENQLYL